MQAQPKNTKKRIQYYRAIQDNHLVNLESFLRNLLHNNLRSVNDSQVEQYGNIYRIQHRNLDFILTEQTMQTPAVRQGLLLQIVSGTQDEEMRTMNNDAPNVNDDGGSLAPPQGQSFIAKEAYLYINSHNVLFINNGLRPESVSSYLKQLYNDNNRNNDDSLLNFELKPVADIKILDLIRMHGVRRLHLNASAYKLSLSDNNINDGSIIGFFKRMGTTINQLIQNEPTEEDLKASEDICVNISLRLDGNTKAAAEAQEFMIRQAEDIALSDDEDIHNGLVIETQRGDKISPSQVRLFKQIKIRKHEHTNTLNQSDVTNGVREYFHELIDSNLIES